MALLETLQDDFAGTTLKPQWTSTYTGAVGGGVNVGSGALNLVTWVGSDAATVARVVSTAAYTFTDSYALIRAYPDTPMNSQLYNFKIRSPGGTEYFLMQWNNGNLVIEARDGAGADIFPAVSVAFNTSTMLWWRIRHTAGTLYFETMFDGNNWVVHKSAAYTPAEAAYHLETGVSWLGTPPQSRSAQVDNVNLPPQPLETLRDDFGGTTLDPLRWTSTTQGTAVTVGVAGGTLNFDVSVKGSSTHSGTVTSVGTFAFTNTYLLAQVTPTTSTTGTTTGLRVRGSGNSEEFTFTKSGTTLTMRGLNTGGATITTLGIAYNSTTMAWWRIRHTGTVMYWETAQYDYGPWAIQRQATYTPAIASYIAIMDFVWIGATLATVTRFDNVNTIPSYSVIELETLGPPASVATAPPMHTLVDDFTTLANWFLHGNGVSADVSGGTLNLVTQSALSAPLGGVSSMATYDLMESYVFVKVVTTGSSTTQNVLLVVANPSNAKEFFQIYKLSSTLYFRGWDTIGNAFVSSTTAYSATTHAWWKIRHTAGVIYWETSADGTNWTIRDQGTYAPSTRAMRVRLETGFTSTSAATTMRYDNVNVDLALKPDSITHPETLGAPAATFSEPSVPVSIGDPEFLGDPTAQAGRKATPAGVAVTTVAGVPDLTVFREIVPGGVPVTVGFGTPTVAYRPPTGLSTPLVGWAVMSPGPGTQTGRRPILRAASSAQDDAARYLRIDVPESTRVGDLMMMIFGVVGTARPQTPPGWTVLQDTTAVSGGVTGTVFARPAGPTDAGTTIAVATDATKNTPLAAALGVYKSAQITAADTTTQAASALRLKVGPAGDYRAGAQRVGAGVAAPSNPTASIRFSTPAPPGPEDDQIVPADIPAQAAAGISQTMGVLVLDYNAATGLQGQVDAIVPARALTLVVDLTAVPYHEGRIDGYGQLHAEAGTVYDPPCRITGGASMHVSGTHAHGAHTPGRPVVVTDRYPYQLRIEAGPGIVADSYHGGWIPATGAMAGTAGNGVHQSPAAQITGSGECAMYPVIGYRHPGGPLIGDAVMHGQARVERAGNGAPITGEAVLHGEGLRTWAHWGGPITGEAVLDGERDAAEHSGAGDPIIGRPPFPWLGGTAYGDLYGRGDGQSALSEQYTQISAEGLLFIRSGEQGPARVHGDYIGGTITGDALIANADLGKSRLGDLALSVAVGEPELGYRNAGADIDGGVPVQVAVGPVVVSHLFVGQIYTASAVYGIAMRPSNASAVR